MKILLGMPHRNNYMPVVMAQLVAEMKKLCFARGYSLHIRPICGAMVNVARNAYLEIAYKEGYDYLFWLDDDNPVDVVGLIELIKAKKDIIGAIVPQRRKDKDGKHSLNVFKIKSQVGNLIEYEKLTKVPEEKIVEVDALATSCMLLNRNAIEKIYDRYGGHPFEHRIEWYTDDGKIVDVDSLEMDDDVHLTCNHIGGDMIFCRRAKAIGLSIFVDTTIETSHLVEDNSVYLKDFR